jgi:hypothetical protein
MYPLQRLRRIRGLSSDIFARARSSVCIAVRSFITAQDDRRERTLGAAGWTVYLVSFDASVAKSIRKLTIRRVTKLDCLA